MNKTRSILLAMLAFLLATVFFAVTSEAQNKVDLSRQSKGILPNAQVPTPASSALGGIKSFDCGLLGAGWTAQKIDTTGTVTCVNGGSAITLNHNGSANTSQAILNLQDGTGTTVSNPSAGNVQVNVVYGSGANTAAAGNDARITGAEQTANKGANSGYAGLDGAAHQLCSQESQLTGDVTSAAGSCVTLLPNIVTAGTNLKTTYNAKGQITSGTTAATTDLSDNSVIVKNNQANTYTAGSKQTVQASATTAGFNFAGVNADPSSLANGDVWHRSDLSGFFARLGGATHQFALFSSLPTNGNCVNASIVASAVFLGDAGAPCGAGGGGGVPPGSALGLGMTRVSSTEFDVGAECTNSTPCNIQTPTGPVTFNSANAPAKIILSGSATAGTARIDVASGTGSQPGIGTITVYYDAGASNITTCTNCTAATASVFPNYGEVPIGTLVSTGSPATWPATPTTDLRGGMSMFFVFPGTGINISGAGNNVIGLATPVTTASGGTNVTSSGAAGQYLRSNGSDWTSSALLAGDLPSVPPIASIPVDSGAVNAYVIAPSPAFTSLANGDIAYFVTATANTGASTINVNGLGIKNITKKGATALVSGDILAGSPKAIYKLVYDGTEWQLINPSTSGGAGTVTSVATTSPITGGTFTTSGTIACATCVTSAAALTSGQLVTGAGGQASQVSNLSGDVTTAGSTATTVVKVNGAAVPTSAAIVGTNASQQIIAHTLVAADLPIATSSAVGGVIPRDNHVVDASGNLDFDPSDVNVAGDWDEFWSGSGSATNQVGKLGWTLNSIVASPTGSGQAGVYPHYGIERVASIATSGDGGTLALSPSAVTPLGDMKTNANWSQKWIFRLNQTVTEAFRIGFADNTGSASPNNGIWLRFDTTASDANFKFEARSSSTSDTVVDSSIAVDTAWHKIVIASPSSGKITFQLDAGSVFCITTAASDGACTAGSTFSATHIPTVGLYNIMIMATEAAVISSADVDFFSFKIRGLGR